MIKHKKWILILIAGVAVLILATSAGVALAQKPDESPPSESMFSRFAARAGFGRGWPAGEIDFEALLAEELGITVDELQTAKEEVQTAQKEVRDQALKQAVESGKITQEQADRMSSWGGAGKLGRRGFDMHGPGGITGDPTDYETMFAGALGISVDEVRTAQENAHTVALTQAMEEGIITEEQADMMGARQALKDFLAADEGLTAAYENLKTAHEEAIQNAVADGVISQEQADQMLDADGFGFRGRWFGKFGNRFSTP